jgi:hypothetical protein
MGYTKPKETSRWHLENADLPQHGKTYTVVSHKSVIENTHQLLKDAGFIIQKETYRANMNANVAQGIYHIYPTQTIDQEIVTEREVGMMFAWTNSYDKSTRFQCAIGAYVMVCYNGMIAGDLMNFKRKHTGSADYDVKTHIADQIKNAEKHYKRIIKDKELMKTIDLDCKQKSELTGRLFIDEDILDSQQVSLIKKSIKDDDKDPFNLTAWAFYNYVTLALKKAHPRDWMQDSQDFHDFMMAECVSLSVKTSNDSIKKLDIIMEDTPEYIEVDEINQNVFDRNY